eukprot:COSAG06_NODE_60588_length_270_cov_0.883041_1_plen_24_part_10
MGNRAKNRANRAKNDAPKIAPIAQ